MNIQLNQSMVKLMVNVCQQLMGKIKNNKFIGSMGIS